MITIESLIEAEQKLAEYKHIVITRPIHVDSNDDSTVPEASSEYLQMLSTLYDIDHPFQGKIPKQDSWYMGSFDYKLTQTGVSKRYRVRFKRSDHAALFKLAWG